jgi:O-acetyl-ADP-ribose deacetylase (regulator of RNase III)
MITILNGDATAPTTPGVKIIAHVCNDENAWGSGFVLAVSAKWKRPEEQYRKWAGGDSETDMTGGSLVLTPPIFRLGETQLIQVEPEIYVANMVAQKLYSTYHAAKNLKAGDTRPPIRYEALKECLQNLKILADKLDASVHMPRIGCERAGGSWAKVEDLVTLELDGLDIYVYDFPGSNFNP